MNTDNGIVLKLNQNLVSIVLAQMMTMMMTLVVIISRWNWHKWRVLIVTQFLVKDQKINSQTSNGYEFRTVYFISRSFAVIFIEIASVQVTQSKIVHQENASNDKKKL